LPSVAELHELYLQRDVVGGFDSDSDYWSSTEYDGLEHGASTSAIWTNTGSTLKALQPMYGQFDIFK